MTALLSCVYCEWVAVTPGDEESALILTAEHEYDCERAS